MIKAFLTFAVATLSVASAATYKINFVEPSVVKGQSLKAGDYKLDVKDNTVVIEKGKQQIEVPVKVENMHQHYDRTRVLYNENKGKFTIQEIEIGGTTTKITFDTGVQTGGGE